MVTGDCSRDNESRKVESAVFVTQLFWCTQMTGVPSTVRRERENRNDGEMMRLCIEEQ